MFPTTFNNIYSFYSSVAGHFPMQLFDCICYPQRSEQLIALMYGYCSNSVVFVNVPTLPVVIS